MHKPTMPQWAHELPYQLDAYMGHCPICDSNDRLIFLLVDSKGKYEHCMICGQEWRLTCQ